MSSTYCWSGGGSARACSGRFSVKGRSRKGRLFCYPCAMPTPAAVEPPTPENVHLYRAAVLSWRKATIEERSRHADVKLVNPHVAEHAAARAVHALAPEMTYAQAFLLAEKATAIWQTR
jgi:hypothetical protein